MEICIIVLNKLTWRRSID